MREELQAILVEIGELNRRGDEAKSEWRLRHIEALDARICVKKNCNKDIVAAEG